MNFPLLPVMMTDRVTDLTPEYLQGQGIRLLMLDFDNTIVPYTTDVPTAEMAAWLERMKASDIQLCVVSNSHKDRVKIFCKAWGIPCITHSKKPFSKGICQCLEQFGAPKEACALVGDQIFTDTLGANCAGVRSILVKAIDNHTWLLKLRHLAEIPFVYLARKRRIGREEHR